MPVINHIINEINKINQMHTSALSRSIHNILSNYLSIYLSPLMKPTGGSPTMPVIFRLVQSPLGLFFWNTDILVLFTYDDCERYQSGAI